MRFVRCKTTSCYEAMIITPEQAYAIVRNLREPERTLTLLAEATVAVTGKMLQQYGRFSTPLRASRRKPSNRFKLRLAWERTMTTFITPRSSWPRRAPRWASPMRRLPGSKRVAEGGMPNYPLFRDNPSMSKLRGNPEYDQFMAEFKPRWDQLADVIGAPGLNV